MSIEIDKKEFERLAKENKEALIEKLKTEDIVRIFYNKQKFFDYKVFNFLPTELFIKKEDETILPPNYRAIILSDIDLSNVNILRENFRFWYFINNETSFYKTTFVGEQSNFSGSLFFSDKVDFFACEFKSKRTDFSACEFQGKRISFSESQFYGRQAYFLGATFYCDTVDFSKAEFYTKYTDFSKTEFFSSKVLSFLNADFVEQVNFDSCNFAKMNIFIGSNFKNGANFDVFRLCENKGNPKLLDLNDDFKTKENLHSVKRLLNKIEKFDQEDHILYWYKIYERRSDNKFIRKLFFPFEWLFLDKMTGYFTKSSRILFSIFFVLVFFFSIYTFAIFLSNDFVGELVLNNLNFSDILKDEKLDIIIKLKKVLGNAFYFNLATYSTLGYGDILPTGFLKIVAGIESVVGILMNSIFLIVLTRKILR